MYGEEVKRVRGESDRLFRLLRRAYLFCEFSDEELKALIPELQPKLRRYSAGRIVVNASTDADRLGIVETGQVSARRTTIDGETYVSKQYEPGEIFGLNMFGSSPETWHMSFAATMNSSILSFSVVPFITDDKDYRTVWRNLRVWRRIAHLGIDQWNRMDIRDIARSAATAKGKILTFFDLMMDKHGSNSFSLRMTRFEFAQFLGVGRSSLYRELANLQKEGMITITNKREVTVHMERAL